MILYKVIFKSQSDFVKFMPLLTFNKEALPPSLPFTGSGGVQFSPRGIHNLSSSLCYLIASSLPVKDAMVPQLSKIFRHISVLGKKDLLSSVQKKQQ